jgi:hypothetical protein
MKTVNRYHRRSRNFCEVQRKMHNLLTHMDGPMTMHYDFQQELDKEQVSQHELTEADLITNSKTLTAQLVDRQSHFRSKSSLQ